MDDRQAIGDKARLFFDDLWKQGDFWQLETSEFERDKYFRQMKLLAGRRYGRVLEIGCGSGCFSRLISACADRVVAIDVSPLAIARARALAAGAERIDFRVANIMELEPVDEGPFDLVVMSETIYYLGWLYPFWSVAWRAKQIFLSITDGGQLLMANTCCLDEDEDFLMQPWIISIYRDMFLNVGFGIDAEDRFTGTKDGRDRDVLISLFGKQAK